jgi:hypothetical protein
MAFDIQETTVQINHTDRTVNFYTTRRSVFLQFVKRNPNYIKATQIPGGGYEVDYPLSEVKGAALLLKLQPGSAEDKFLTDEEKARRAESGERLRAVRAAS